MTADKQIVINDVDVSGCEYYFDNKCRCMDASIMQDFYSYPQCNSNPNCHYKQLKRKEKECERLKAEIKLSKEMLIQNTSETNKYTIPQIIEEFISDNYIDQQNEDGYTIPVFIQIENILDIKEDLEQQFDQFKADREEALKQLEFVRTLNTVQEAENRKLSKTLTEIREFVKNEMTQNGDTYIVLQKINEVIPDEKRGKR